MTDRTFITGADLVLPDRVLDGHTLVIEDGRIADIAHGPLGLGTGDFHVDGAGGLVVPGFIDVHVHGVSGHDTLGGTGALDAIARALPRFGVTAFCPTSVACEPETLDAMLAATAARRAAPIRGAARVLPAHVEGPFIHPHMRGAQPGDCLRQPPVNALDDQVLRTVHERRADVGIMTLAPELPNGIALVRALTTWGIRAAIGHTAASFDQAQASIGAGVRHATHLFNRMTPMTPRDPGVVGAVLAADDVVAELICDGHHVHTAVMRVALAAKGVEGLMAITDGTAGSGLPRGARARLGRQEIVVDDVARLADGTMAGSVCTMDRAFACLVSCGAGLVDAARLCATSPAQALGLHGHGVIAVGAPADLVVLSRTLQVRETFVGGVRA